MESDNSNSQNKGNQNKGLSPRQQKALPLIATSSSLKEAADKSGVTVRTLYRWMEDDEFRDELEQANKLVAELASSQLQGLMLQSVAVLTNALKDPSPSVRLRAATTVLAFGAKLGENRELREEIQALGDALPLWMAQQASL